MPRKNIFNQLRGVFENAVENVKSLFGRGKPDPDTDAELPPVQVPEPVQVPDEPTEFVQSERIEASEPFEVRDPLDDLSPEEILDLDDDDFPIMDSSDFDSGSLRRIFATGQEAENYASEIPIPSIVFKRSLDGLYQVAVEYP